MSELLTGDARAVLKSLPAESVHCAVTSPPYWGLRDYKTEPVVWGGDYGCHHVWELPSQPRRVRKESECKNSPKQISNKGSVSVGNTPSSKSTLRNGYGVRPGEKFSWENAEIAANGYFCTSCGAWLGSLGLEPTADLYIEHLVEIFRELRCVLRKDGTFWLNLGDSTYRGQWALVPARVALAMQADGWLLRSEVVWAKPNPMPESVKNRCTKSHEMLYMFSKSSKYFFDMEAIKEPATGAAGGTRSLKQAANSDRNDGNRVISGRFWRQKRDVWWISSEPLKDEHYAAFPTKLVEPCVLAGTSEKGVCPTCGEPWERQLRITGQTVSDETKIAAFALKGVPRTTANLYATSGQPRGQTSTIGWRQTCTCPEHAPIPATVLDPFSGSGTVGVVCLRTGRNFLGIDLKPEYHDIARRRLEKEHVENRQSKLSTTACAES